MTDGKLVSVWEEELRRAQSLEELKQRYEEAQRQINGEDLKKLYKVYEKREFEIKKAQFEQLKADLAKKKKKYKKERLDIRVKVVKKWINTRLFTAEHYVAMLQESKDGLQLLFLRKVKLIENQGYLMLENRKLRKSWVINGEPLLLEKSRYPFGKKFVAVHFVLPNFPYTLNLTIDDKIRQLTLKTINAPQIIHSVIKTKFFEALAKVGSGPDLMMLVIGAVMGIGIGVAVGFGIANANLTHLLSQHVANTTTTTHTTSTTSPNFTVPSNGTKG